MLSKRQQHFQEPGCATNAAKGDKERTKGCGSGKGALKPGAAAGGCAYDGAKVALQPITDAAHLVHGPIACEGNAWDNRHAASSGPMLYRRGLTTDLSEMDVIHGGEKKVYQAIKAAVRRHAPPAVFVYQTCVPALIGDDLEAVCKRAAEKMATPVIPVMAPGFAGSKNLGNKLAARTLFDHVIGTEEPDDATDRDVLIIGDYNLSGELWQVTPLFERIGIRLRACITGDARYRDVATAHRARAAMVVCSHAMAPLARGLEERYGIPWFEGSFHGLADTGRAVLTMARLLVERGADPALLERAEAVVAEEGARAEQRLAPYRARLRGKRVLLYTGGHKTWSVVSALQELGMRVIGTSVRKATDEDAARARTRIGEDGELFGQIAAPEMYRMLRDREADIMLSGGRTQFVALKARTPWLDINQERHFAYAGFDGMVTLARQLDRALGNPVFETVRRPAPWEDGAA